MRVRLATAVSAYPFYNFRYLKLLDEFARVFDVYCFAGSALGRRVRRAGFRLVHVYPFTVPRRIRYVVGPYVAQFFMNVIRADVVWLFDTATALAPNFLRSPAVLDVEDPKVVLPPDELAKQSRLSFVHEMRMLRDKRFRKIVVTTEMIRRKFVSLGVDKERIEVIPYGVDTELFKPSPLPDEPVVLYYGTFQPHRAQLLVKVVEKVASMRSDIRFLLVGDVPQPVATMLKKVAGDRVEMPGFVPHDELPKWIQKSRICILTQDRSLGGRLSFKLLEYMASGRPVVSTDVDESFPVRDSGAGIVTPIDADAMANAIIQLIDDDALAKQMAERGVNYAKQFDWRMMVDKYVNLIKQVAQT
ncbi:MAG: glycosyltransferase family 4 protein [Candidatus Caldarchaeum sp.]|uniref:Glycosyltransferase family 1 protein n=1 Tax=Caldiarchaeum subterraneum TaxID=311458 RepID=A0A7C4I5F6_CALS0